MNDSSQNDPEAPTAVRATTPSPVPVPVLAVLALSAMLAAYVFALKVSREHGPGRPPLATRAPAIEAWPRLLEPMPDGLRLELDLPRSTDLTATVYRHARKGPPVAVTARTISSATTGPLDCTGLTPETEYELRLTANGSRVIPARVPFSTRPPRALQPGPADLPALLAISEDLDPKETDRVAALWRAAAPLPAVTYPPAIRLAERMRSRPLLAALVDQAPPDLPAPAWLDLANLALDLGDRDRSRAAFRHCPADAPGLETGSYARAALELEGPSALPATLALLERRPPLDTARAATALARCSPEASRATERWLASPAPLDSMAAARRARLALACSMATARLDTAGSHEAFLSRVQAQPSAARELHHVARLFVDTGRPEARRALYAHVAREPRALDDPGLIWELARAAAGETASDATRTALDALGTTLVTVMQSGAPLETREAAAAALGIVPAPGAIPALGEAVRSAPPRVAAAAAWALVTRSDRTHVSSLYEMAESPRDETGVAAWACGMLGTRDAVERLAAVLSRLPRDRSALPRRLLVGFAMARLGNDGRGWQALDDARTDLPFGHFLALQVRAGRDTIWLFPFVGLAPLTARLLPGQSVQVQTAGYWCARVNGQWLTSPATRPLGDDPSAARIAVSVDLAPHSTQPGITPLTVVAHQSTPALARLSEPRVTDPLPIVSPATVAGCATIRVRVAAP